MSAPSSHSSAILSATLVFNVFRKDRVLAPTCTPKPSVWKALISERMVSNRLMRRPVSVIPYSGTHKHLLAIKFTVRIAVEGYAGGPRLAVDLHFQVFHVGLAVNVHDLLPDDLLDGLTSGFFTMIRSM